LKNGPVVRTCFNVARPSQGGARPLRQLTSLRGLMGPAPADNGSDTGPPSGPSSNIHSLQLGSCLPINLREFLLAEFGGGLRIEDDVVYFLRPRAGDLFVRELARAIRRFSYLRAQEQWTEYAIERSRLETDLVHRAGSDYAVILCLECERFSAGASTEHQEERCVAIVLAKGGRDSQAEPPKIGPHVTAGRGLYPVIEEFRLARQQAGLSHFGLDYYVANDHVVFTWQRSRKAEPVRPKCSVVDNGRRLTKSRFVR
jgi:hypothetical protein